MLLPSSLVVVPDDRKEHAVNGHIHRFRALIDRRTGRNITKWKCSCGLKVRDRAVAEALNGKPL